MKMLALILATGSLVAVSAPALAMLDSTEIVQDRDRYDDDYDRDDDDYRRDRRAERDEGIYRRDGRYREPRRIGKRDRMWRGRDGKVYCERDNGTTGLVIGAGVGALLGRTIDTEGDRTAGTLLGALAGGLIGREIDRSELRCE